MLHDELLEKIKVFLFATELQSIDEDFEGTKMLKALYAIVKLHKPHEDMQHLCKECWSEYSFAAYPCPTIQAIENNIS